MSATIDIKNTAFPDIRDSAARSYNLLDTAYQEMYYGDEPYK